MSTDQPPRSPRSLAIEAAAAVVPQATGLVEYRSEGHLVIIGPTHRVSQAVEQVAPDIRVRALLTDGPGTDSINDKTGRSPDSPPPGLVFEPARAGSITVSGYLGQFEISSDAPLQRADIVLDLGDQPRLSMPLKPAGYFAPGSNDELAEAIASLNQLIGRFDKPKFFAYQENICAHGASGLTGCRACIDACPAEAIISIGETVEVNPYLCQGGGACATACPTGAMTYRYPGAADTLDRIRRMLRAYHDAGGSNAQLVLHAQAYDVPASGSEQLPLALEELASVGIELWLAALAFGARGVFLATPADTQAVDATVPLLQQQMDIANSILSGLGFPPAVQWLDNESPRAQMPSITAATFGATGGKRDILFAAIDHLVAQAGNPPAAIDLPDGAPLGRIQVQTAGCTLCMSCVSVCPAKALADGGDRPALRMFEVNCVQCGLCETACPEKVISRQPRLLTDAAKRREAVDLHREEPFCCIRCNKPFATRSVIDRMAQKLAGHQMFQDAGAMDRLRMCGDCRVLDMMKDDL